MRASSRAFTPRVGLAGAAAVVAVVGIALTAPSPAAHSTPAAPPQQLLDPQSLIQAPAEPQAAPDVHHSRATGRIGDDLTAALEAAAVPERIGREYVGLLSRALPLANELSVEDKFDLVYESGAEGRLLFAGLDRVGRADLALVKWTDGKSVIWVNADGAPANGENMRMPVSGPVTSKFGSRFHPILGHARMHRGVDMRASAGSPIVAAAGGRVVAAGWRGGYGRQVAIAHGDGVQTTYSHMSRIAASAGQTVRQGQVIGYVGSSGLSTGPHLHYEVYKNGRAVNPLSVKFAGQPPLADEKLHAVRDALRGLLAPKSPNS